MASKSKKKITADTVKTVKTKISKKEEKVSLVSDVDYEDEGVVEADVPDELDLDDLPELVSIPATKEVYAYKPIIHNELVFINPVNRITSEMMSMFEYTEVISQRAKQIENGGLCFTDTGELTNPLDLAKKELFDKKCPLDIVRNIADGIAERWHVNEMGIPNF